jgi:hypothetical protein
MRYMNTKSLMIASVLLAAVLTLTGVIEPDPLAFAVVGVGMLDVFKQDAFSIITLSDAINKIPFIPGRAGKVIDWNENGIPTTSIAIEEVNGVLQLVNPTPRGGPGSTSAKQKRTARTLAVPHYQVDDAIYADEVQGVRAFGQENQVQTVFGRVTERMTQHVQQTLDPTLEYQRIGAVKGIIVNQDGSTLYNLFTEFGVAQPAEVAFDLANLANGDVRALCDAVIRVIATALGGLTYQGVHAFASDSFWDALIKNAEVRATYLQQQEASQLRTGTAYQTLNFGGVTFENYRGSVGSTKFITDDKCNIFPVGVPGLWRTVYAPADYIETVNTIGLPRYAKQWQMDNGKGVHLETQSNPFSYCTRPNCLVQGKLGA